MKTKRDRIGVRLQTENFIRKHIFCLGRRLYVIDHAMITVNRCESGARFTRRVLGITRKNDAQITGVTVICVSP